MFEQTMVTDYFPIKIGLHQGSALSPYLFALVMDEVTRNIQGISWCMLFADDVVLVDESQAGVNRKLELSQNQPIYKSTSTKTIAETIKFSNLSPYKPGSQLKSRRISNQLAYNQDHSNST